MMPLNAELAAIRDALGSETGEGMDVDLARSLANDYVAAHPGEFTEIATKTLEECVAAVDVFREAGMPNEQWRIETWVLHRWKPQNIGAVMGPEEWEH